MKNTAVSKEVALDELAVFVNKFVKKPVPQNELEEVYPDVLDAIIEGYLSFDSEGLPKLKLKFPVLDENKSPVLSEITFRTRIKPTTLANLAKGLHPQKEVFQLQLNMTSYIIDQSVAMLDKFERYDYDVISQVSSVFT